MSSALLGRLRFNEYVWWWSHLTTIESLITISRLILNVLLALSEDVSIPEQSNASGVEMSMGSGDVTEPIEELLPDFDFSQFITDTAEEFLFR